MVAAAPGARSTRGRVGADGVGRRLVCARLRLTVDLAVVGARYRDTRNGLVDPIGLTGKVRRGIDLVRHVQWVRDVAIDL